MPTPRNHSLAAAIDGKIYALSGRTGSVFVNMAPITDLIEMYDPDQDTWTLGRYAGVYSPTATHKTYSVE